MNRANILIIAPYLPDDLVGGIATWTSDFVSFLRTQELDFDVLNNTPKKQNNKSGKTKRFSFSKIIFNFKIKKVLKDKIKGKHFDLVHINSSCSPLGIYRDYQLMKICKKKHIPIILHCHCNIEDQIKSHRFGLHYLKAALNYADAIFVLNKHSWSYVSSLSTNKAFVIPNFISKLNILESREINKTLTNICFVGHLLKDKGVNDLILAAASYPNIMFNFVGEVTNEVKLPTNKQENVRFLGSLPRKQVFTVLDSSDVFILPSKTEGFSIALLEAMSRGLPVITTDVGANKEMIEEKGGFLVRFNDVPGLVSKIESMSSFALRDQMSKWNIAKVAENYTIETVAKSIITIYSSIINPK